MKCNYFSFFVFVVFAFSCKTSRVPARYEGAKQVSGRRGAVVCAHPLAARVGIDILKKGGNAIDAAIATQLALAVVYPGAGNLGGGGFLVAWMAGGKTLALDFRETAPAAASRDMYLDSAGRPVAGMSTRSATSSGVPGTVAGLFESMQYASLPFDSLVAPAIVLADNGFPLSEAEAEALNNLQPDLAANNTMRSAFQRGGPWKAGDLLVQHDLANTLRRILQQGRAGFYEGETARLITAEMKRGAGFITTEDLRQYQAKWREPYRFAYKGYDVVSMPLPSSGGILLHQMMKMVEDRPLKTYGPLSYGSVQLMTEVERRAYADRGKFLGDADFIQVPVARLTSAGYLRARMRDYDSLRAGSSTTVQPGEIGHESEETTHISIIDSMGNAVAVTTTLNDSYGSRTVVGGAGFLLNDEMDDFSIKPGVPNMYGAVGGEANAITPGKRMLSSMTPAIVLKNNKPCLVAGTPGGTTIPTSVFQTIVDVIEFGLTARQAVDLPKFHHQWLPDVLYVENNFPDSLRSKLAAAGYTLVERGAIGRTEVIRILPDGSFEAAADKRGSDSAEGY